MNPIPLLFLLLLAGCICDVSVEELDFGSIETTKTFILWIAGSEQDYQDWYIDKDAHWMSVEPQSGNRPGRYAIYVTVDRTGLEADSYEEELCLMLNESCTTCRVIVRMEVVEGDSLTSTTSSSTTSSILIIGE